MLDINQLNSISSLVIKRKARLTAAKVTVEISAQRPGSHPSEMAMEPERATRFIHIVFEAHHFLAFSMYVLLCIESIPNPQLSADARRSAILGEIYSAIRR